MNMIKASALAAASVVALGGAAWGQGNPVSTTATAAATILEPLTITEDTPMDFGTIAVDVAATGGTIGSDGSGSGVTVVSGTQSNGLFDVNGTAGETVDFTTSAGTCADGGGVVTDISLSVVDPASDTLNVDDAAVVGTLTIDPGATTSGAVSCSYTVEAAYS